MLKTERITRKIARNFIVSIRFWGFWYGFIPRFRFYDTGEFYSICVCTWNGPRGSCAIFIVLGSNNYFSQKAQITSNVFHFRLGRKRQNSQSYGFSKYFENLCSRVTWSGEVQGIWKLYFQNQGVMSFHKSIIMPRFKQNCVPPRKHEANV